MINKDFYIGPATANLEKVIDVNKYIDTVTPHFIQIPTATRVLIRKNRDVDAILQRLSTVGDVISVDQYLSFWVYETALSPLDKSHCYNGLNTKDNLVLAVIQSVPDLRHEFQNEPIKLLLQEVDLHAARHKRRKDQTLIVTAVPIEFRAMMRRLSLVLSVSNRDLIETILDPNTPEEDIKRRPDFVWVDGLIQRDGYFTKVRLVLLEEYGANTAQTALREIAEDDYIVPEEIIVVGVAGHLDKTNRVKIGDLVISDKYFVGYDKATESIDSKKKRYNDVSYENTEPIALSSDYSVPGRFEPQSWSPTKMLVEKPSEPTKYRRRYIGPEQSTVYMGPFVCVPGVVKQTFRKKRLQEVFKHALALEMEVYGCHEFAKKKKIRLKVVKGICDWSSPEKDKQWQPYCAEIASEFTADYLIAKYGIILTDK